MTPERSDKASLLQNNAVSCACAGCGTRASEYYVLATTDRPYLCGRCMDALDNEAMPYLTSEYAWQIRKPGEAA